MRIQWLVSVFVLALALAAGDAFAQGNSGCSGTVQNPVEDATPCNAYGLCKAYFAGSPTGQANKRQAPPFMALEAIACGACESGCECDPSNNDESMCNDDVQQCVAAYCPDTNPGGKGKNPSDGSPGQSKRQGG